MTKEILQFIQGKDAFSINETDEIGYSSRKINTASTYRYTKVILKWILYLNIKVGSTELPDKNMGEHLYNLGEHNDFLKIQKRSTEKKT